MNRDLISMVDAAMTEMQNISPPLRRSECERLIVAALTAQGAAERAVPVGYVRVPVEPTPEMKRAAQSADMDHTAHAKWLDDDWPDFRRIWDAMLAAAPATPAPQCLDDAAVDRFAPAMKEKLADARAKGRSGWDDPECSQERLSRMLREHVAKGDPRDVANFCMFLWCRGEAIAPYEASNLDGENYAASFLQTKGYLPSLGQAFAAGAAKTPNPTSAQDFSDVIAIQRREAEADPTDAYMVGLYNGMAMMDANYRGDMAWEPMKVQATSPAPAAPAQQESNMAAPAQDGYPPLPAPTYKSAGMPYAFTADKMRAYVDADRAARAAAPVAPAQPVQEGERDYPPLPPADKVMTPMNSEPYALWGLRKMIAYGEAMAAARAARLPATADARPFPAFVDGLLWLCVMDAGTIKPLDGAAALPVPGSWKSVMLENWATQKDKP